MNVVFYWLPPFLWMGMIFYMSSQRSISITKNVISDFVTFKTLHMIEYAFLFFLFYRAFQSFRYIRKEVCGVLAFLIAISYSVSDEIHQLSIPTRQGRVRDILFDIVGMVIMYVIIRKVRHIQKLL